MRKIMILIFTFLSFFIYAQICQIEISKEKFIEENFDNYANGRVVVSIYFNYDPLDISNTGFQTRKDKQTYTRKLNYQYYTDMNNYYNEKISVHCDDVEISSYSPFIMYYYNSLEGYTRYRNFFIDLSKSDIIKCIFVEKDYLYEEDLYINASSSNENISLDEIKDIIGIYDENYLGNNINIGILDSGYSSNYNLNSNYFNINCDVESTHASLMATIFSDIASNANIYFCTRYRFENSIRELFDVQIDAIMMSYGSDVNGNYTSIDLKLDYIARYNDCIFICSSGNSAVSATQSRYVDAPGAAVNVITVGSVDKEKHISCFSSYGLNSDITGIIKPDIVAPGENIILNNISIVSGTSFSVPIVAGVLAKLMQEFYWTDSTEIFIPAILNGATKLPGQIELISEYCGSGLVNYSNSRQILENQYYYCFYVNDYVQEDILLYQGTYQIECYSVMDLYLYHMYNALDCNLNDSINLQVMNYITKYKIEIYENDNLIQSSILDSNIGIIEYSNNSSNSKIYVLKIFLIGNKIESGQEKILFTYKYSHEHHYNSFNKYNIYYHEKNCNCGNLELDIHTVESGTSIFSRCIYCGQFVDTRNVIVRYE